MNSLRFARFASIRMTTIPAFMRTFAGFAEFAQRIPEIVNCRLEGC
jgi:hypothetical protein